MKNILSIYLLFGFLLVFGNEKYDDFEGYPWVASDYEFHIKEFDSKNSLFDWLNQKRYDVIIGVWDGESLRKVNLKRKSNIEYWWEIEAESIDPHSPCVVEMDMGNPDTLHTGSSFKVGENMDYSES